MAQILVNYLALFMKTRLLDLIYTEYFSIKKIITGIVLDDTLIPYCILIFDLFDLTLYIYMGNCQKLHLELVQKTKF